ncbi:MAG: hypothetical protein MK324_16240, partial [Pirellulales bacterium]|nr:hypothetical protein [Pirellulales bacterium]
MSLISRILIVFFLMPLAVQAQPVGKLLDLRAYGLNIPPGKVIASQGQTVLTMDEFGKSVVGKVHVTVGNYHIVLLPDGQLVGRSITETKETNRPFTGAD